MVRAPEPTAKQREDILDFVQKVRNFMRDKPQLNRLIVGEESSNKDIVQALEQACMDWNMTPPPIGSISILDYPSEIEFLLLQKAASILLESVSILQDRNNLPYSDGQGISTSSAANGPVLRSIADRMLARYDRDKVKYKVFMNINSGWGGGMHSDLRMIQGYSYYF